MNKIDNMSSESEVLKKFSSKCVGRVLQSLEIAGIENKALKDQIKSHIWKFKKDVEENLLNKESKESDNDESGIHFIS